MPWNWAKKLFPAAFETMKEEFLLSRIESFIPGRKPSAFRIGAGTVI
jgi:hypothetical protein